MGAGITFIVIAILFAMLGITAEISRRRPAVTRRALPLRPRPHRVPSLLHTPAFRNTREVSRRALPAEVNIHCESLIGGSGE